MYKHNDNNRKIAGFLPLVKFWCIGNRARSEFLSCSWLGASLALFTLQGGGAYGPNPRVNRVSGPNSHINQEIKRKYFLWRWNFIPVKVSTLEWFDKSFIWAAIVCLKSVNPRPSSTIHHHILNLTLNLPLFLQSLVFNCSSQLWSVEFVYQILKFIQFIIFSSLQT